MLIHPVPWVRFQVLLKLLVVSWAVLSIQVPCGLGELIRMTIKFLPRTLAHNKQAQ
jgi:hypothetical protein